MDHNDEYANSVIQVTEAIQLLPWNKTAETIDATVPITVLGAGLD